MGIRRNYRPIKWFGDVEKMSQVIITPDMMRRFSIPWCNFYSGCINKNKCRGCIRNGNNFETKQVKGGKTQFLFIRYFGDHYKSMDLPTHAHLPKDITGRPS